MKALVYHDQMKTVGTRSPDPVPIDNTDAVVRVDATTICGSDLDILKGDLPEVISGRNPRARSGRHRRRGRRSRETRPSPARLHDKRIKEIQVCSLTHSALSRLSWS